MIEARLGLLKSLYLRGNVNHKPVEKSKVVFKIGRLFQAYCPYLTSRSLPDPAYRQVHIAQLICEIFQEFIYRDFFYLIINQGRPRSMPLANNSKSDPWKNFLHYYFINGHRTPSTPLNDLCS